MEVNDQILPRQASVAGINFYLSGEMIDKNNFDWSGFCTYRKKLLTGEIINESENRAAWHSEFRNPTPCGVVQKSLQDIRRLSEKIRCHQFLDDIKDIVNIGIGGSDLGPKLICEAFEDDIDGPNIHFVSNLDAVQMSLTLRNLSPEKTLFIATSKSFNTLETIENLVRARQWLLDHKQNPAKHIVAVTANREKAVVQFQIPDQQVLDIPEWVGGRYSLWSAVGLSIAAAFGFNNFYSLHQGAREMDQHFAENECSQNMPLQYALLLNQQIKQRDVKTLGIIPYAYRLRSLAPYLQQLFMESLGKNAQQDGSPVSCYTGPIVYGGIGSNVQHSFQQLLMQGTHSIAVDYILTLSQAGSTIDSNRKMMANCLTQVETLRYGAKSGATLKNIQGNQHANLLTIDEMNFKSIGAVVAFYEHVVASMAFLMKINAFDQWGVEINKSKAKEKIYATNTF